MPSRSLLSRHSRMRRPHALFGGVALLLVALWILLALLLPAPANAAVAYAAVIAQRIDC
jgi:hypothetical protein